MLQVTFHPRSMLDVLEMHPWERGGELKKTWRVSCRLGHRRVRYLCNVRTQRVRSCSHYAVWPCQPVVGNVFNLLAQKDTLIYMIVTLQYAGFPNM